MMLVLNGMWSVQNAAKPCGMNVMENVAVMGKLANLWAELKQQQDGARKVEIQNKINGIETWMIENNIGSIKEITNWNKPQNYKKKTGGGKLAPSLNPPITARYGNDRCLACRYHKANYCDPNDKWAHQMYV